ncbi:MAG: orotate phosphoribosyltransferase [Deltaproteobacteria bacterium CG11_big_fil_rev_8_21_14_0_20_45_16]|nr:MAG: orotate phosphoribosyltransferase [Deltaproteobacteria bacterium CG11_big_fil_rev_8_21_14_0_20_45_16]
MSRLLELLKERAFEKKSVKLASGKTSNFYIDVKRVSLHPEGAYLIGKELYALIQEQFAEAKACGGLTLGADPLATAVSLNSWIEKHPLFAFIVRKDAKAHGLSRMIEGADWVPKGAPVVILEDVVTTGKSSIEAIQKVREHGWIVLGVAAIVDRQEGGSETLTNEGVKLASLFTKKDFGITE